MKKLISVKEAGKIFGLGSNRIYGLMKSQPDIPTVRIGETNKINADLFSTWLDKCTLEGRVL